MIRLRELCSTDSELLVCYLNNKKVTRYLSSRLPHPYTLDDANWWLQTGSKQHAIVKAIEVDSVFCGVIGVYLQESEYSHCAEIGYWLGEQFWNPGIGTAALTQFTSSLYQKTALVRLFNPVTAPNKASRRILEKAGFTLEGILINSVRHGANLFDEHLYAKTRPQQQCDAT